MYSSNYHKIYSRSAIEMEMKKSERKSHQLKWFFGLFESELKMKFTD